MGATLGMQTEVRWDHEATDGGGFVDNATPMKLVADVVDRVGLRHTGENEILYDLGDYKPKGVVKGTDGFELVIEFPWQDHAQLYATSTGALLYDLIKRQANGQFKTLAFEILANADGATKSWYTVKGARPATVELRAEPNRAKRWVITLNFLELTRASAQPAFSTKTRQSSIDANPAYFAYIGAAYEAPAGTPLGYSTERLSLTVNHNQRVVPQAGSPNAKTYAPGRQEIRVSADIGVEDGGKALFDASVSRTLADIVIKASTTAGKPKLTVKNAFQPGTDLQFDAESQLLTTSIERVGTGDILLETV
jgi:hypothetical protein